MNADIWRLRCIVLTALGGSLLVPIPAPAQDEDDEVSEIVVTGTRRSGLSPTETLSPVDLIGGEVLATQGTFDVTESLTRISPQLNTQRFPIADGTAFIRPVTLRNLAPDQTLVLMNGSRRHRSALVNLQLSPLGTVNQGSQAVDFAAFPAAAIERVEILRDGASAQYGSDAIAGVINVILKDASEGFDVSTQYGEYYEGDGERWTVSANGGLPLGAEGFLNLTGEYSSSDITSRGVARPDAAFVQSVVGPGVVPLDGLGQRWGDPDVEALKFLVNAGVPVGAGVELYGHASYMDNETVSDFFYREPVLADPADQLVLPARTTLQRDRTGPGGVGGPDGLPDDATPEQVQAIIDAGGNPDDYLTPDGGSPTGYVLRNPIYTEFPGGYNPNFGADLTDMALALGLRGELANNLTWDVPGRYGENEVEYTLSDTINPSFGGLTPLSFTPGTLTQEESGVNADFVKTFEGSPLNIAFGAEWRNETYEIEAGDPASWQAGPTAAIFGVGSDGFQGFPVESAGSFESDSWAGYIDVETDITDRLSASVAARYEDYDQFDDSTFDWKIAGRFQVTDTLAVRATVNTAFRIPTPGQIHTLNVTTTADQSGNLIPNGTYPVDNPVAVVLGSQPLKPEESDNYTAGLVWDVTPDTSITLDYYHIEIDERIALSNHTVTQADVDALTALGYPNPELLLDTSANFFTNGFDSEVDGIDFAINTRFDLAGGDLVVDLRHNFNQQDISDVDPGTINASRVYDLENQVPENRSVLTLDWAREAWGALLRVNWYDDWSTTEGLFSPGDASDQYDYGSAFLVDVEASYSFGAVTVAAGAENLFDEYPDDEEGFVMSNFLGVEHALTSPFGFNGGLWYLRLQAQFGGS